MDDDNFRKLCSSCKQSLPRRRFYKCSAHKDGLQNRCKECSRQGKQVWRDENREHVRARERARKRDPVKMRDAAARWRRRHPELFKARTKACYQANKKGHARTRKKWKRLNPEKLRCYDVNRRARKAAAPGDGWTPEDVVAIKRAQRGLCAYCRVKLGRRFHCDHIKPLALGGAHDRRNVQLCCEPCNLSKGKRDPIDHARTLGLLI